MTTAERSDRRWGTDPGLERKKRVGKLACLILLIYGLLITVLFLLSGLPADLTGLVPFALAYLVMSDWFDPGILFLLLAVAALGAWLLLHFKKLWGREVLIGVMVVYLTLDFFFTPFYLLIGSHLWDLGYVRTVFQFSLCGFVYPVLVLIALHWWNPRRK